MERLQTSIGFEKSFLLLVRAATADTTLISIFAPKWQPSIKVQFWKRFWQKFIERGEDATFTLSFNFLLLESRDASMPLTHFLNFIPAPRQFFVAKCQICLNIKAQYIFFYNFLLSECVSASLWKYFRVW